MKEIVVASVVVILVTLLLGLVTSVLWNWLMPEIFNLPQIDIWQAIGLNILTTVFFKRSK